MISSRYFCNLFLNINLKAEVLISLGSSFHSLAPRCQIEPKPYQEYFFGSDKDHFGMTVLLHDLCTVKVREK